MPRAIQLLNGLEDVEYNRDILRIDFLNIIKSI